MTDLKTHSLRTLVTALVCIALAACHSTRTLPSDEPVATATTATSPLSMLAASYAAADSWTDLNAPFSMKLSRPAAISCSGRATMVRDKSIHLSMRMLGIELAIVHLDADSVWVVDKFHRTMCSRATARLLGDVGLTIGNIQDMMLGRAFYPGMQGLGPTPQRLFSTTAGDDCYIIEPLKQPSRLARWYMQLDSSPALVAAVVDLLSADDDRVIASYSDPVATACGSFPRRILITGHAGKLSVDAAVTWDFSKTRFNTPTDNTWTPPAYRRVPVTEFIKTLKTL